MKTICPTSSIGPSGTVRSSRLSHEGRGMRRDVEIILVWTRGHVRESVGSLHGELLGLCGGPGYGAKRARARGRGQSDWGILTEPRLTAGAEGGGTTGPMSPSGASSRSTITGA